MKVLSLAAAILGLASAQMRLPGDDICVSEITDNDCVDDQQYLRCQMKYTPPRLLVTVTNCQQLAEFDSCEKYPETLYPVCCSLCVKTSGAPPAGMECKNDKRQFVANMRVFPWTCDEVVEFLPCDTKVFNIPAFKRVIATSCRKSFSEKCDATLSTKDKATLFGGCYRQSRLLMSDDELAEAEAEAVEAAEDADRPLTEEDLATLAELFEQEGKWE